MEKKVETVYIEKYIEAYKIMLIRLEEFTQECFFSGGYSELWSRRKL